MCHGCTLTNLGSIYSDMKVTCFIILVLGKWPLVPEQVAPCFFLLLA